MFNKIFCGLLGVFLLSHVAISFEYEGYKLYKIVPKNVAEIEILRQLESGSVDYWVLTRLPGEPSVALVGPEFQDDFEGILTKNGITFSIINQDVSETIKNERIENNARRLLRTGDRFSHFYRYNEIDEFLENIAKKYSNIVELNTVGTSYEGRKMKLIKITNGDGKKDKDVIFIDAGIHAREWIAPAAALYIINELVENHQKNKDLLEKFDWIILPVVNPDGYEYTHLKNRFWRKTRSQNKGSSCYGTDGNRNYGFHWDEVGSSASPCSDIYRGKTEFSEKETQVVRDVLLSLKGRCKMYLTLHSFGSYILYPWGWTSDLPKTWKDLEEVSQAGAKAMLAATGARYTVGSSTNVLYAAAGGSDDYAFGVADVPIAMTMELPGGGSGFDPSPSQIMPMVTETWIGIEAMAKKVIEKYGR